MSGGQYDYFFSKLSCFISDVRYNRDSPLTPKREQFLKLLELVEKACHDIEWVDSADMGPGDEDAALDAVFNFLKSVEYVIFDGYMKDAHFYNPSHSHPELRDQFAMAALQGLLASCDPGKGAPEVVSLLAYKYANAMMEMRIKNGG